MSLKQALDIAMRLKEALTREVTRSQNARAVLKTLDAPALIAQVTERETFNVMSASLSAELGTALGAFANSHGHDELTLADIRRLAPFEGEQLSGVFAEIRALSQALSELDEVNHELAERALTVVRAYVTHLAPRPTAYTRRGQLAAIEGATHSERA